MAEIIAFPARTPDNRRSKCPEGEAPSLPVTSGRRCEYAIGDVARLLKIRHFDSRTIIRKLRALAEEKDMPLPTTPRIYGGKVVTGAQAICLRSRWCAERFDGWHETQDGPEPDLPASSALHARMAERARQLAGA
tara:strand:- start:222 stop:626 length:405 start_codon:yes stop_codon:yes gene_type:complete